MLRWFTMTVSRFEIITGEIQRAFAQDVYDESVVSTEEYERLLADIKLDGINHSRLPVHAVFNPPVSPPINPDFPSKAVLQELDAVFTRIDSPYIPLVAGLAAEVYEVSDESIHHMGIAV